MARFSSVVAVAALLALCGAAAASPRVLVEPHGGVPAEWKHLSKASADDHVHLTIAVRQTNTQALEDTLIR